MQIRKLLSLIITSAMLAFNVTAPAADAAAVSSVPKADTVLAEDTEAAPAAAVTEAEREAPVTTTTTRTMVYTTPPKTADAGTVPVTTTSTRIMVYTTPPKTTDAGTVPVTTTYTRIMIYTTPPKTVDADTVPAATTSDSSTIVISTHETFEFREVLSYPTKTVYNEGEELDITGLEVTANQRYSNSSDDSGGRKYGERYFYVSKFHVTDKNGNGISGSSFNRLPAGDYTVSYDGTIGDYYSFNACFNVKFSYDVTILGSAQTNADVTAAAATTTTTTSAAATEEPERWIYGTGVDHFDSIKTLPTKTIYSEGEELDLSGLVINAHHEVTHWSNKGNSRYIRTDYVWEIESIDPEFITISDITGNTYTADQFSKLKGGTSYDVKFGKSGRSAIELRVKGEEYEKELYDPDEFTFRVYIDPSDKKSKFVRIDNAEVEAFSRGTRNGFKLSGMEAFTIDADAYMHGRDIEWDIRKDDKVSGVLYINPESNYIIFGDLEIVEYGGEAGDTNCDGTIDMADAVLIMQALANPNKYGLEGTDARHITKRGESIADTNGDGLTVLDAQLIQNKLLGL